MKAPAGILLLMFLAAPLTTYAVQFDPPGTLADCDELIRRSPDDGSAYRCYASYASLNRRPEETVRHLETLLSLKPENLLLLTSLAHIEAERGGERALQLFRRAADGFASRQNSWWEVWTRLSLAHYAALWGEMEKAGDATARAVLVADRSGDEELIGRSRIQWAAYAYRLPDYTRARQLLRDVEPLVLGLERPDLRYTWFHWMGATEWAIGRFGDALDYYRLEVDLLHEQGEFHDEAAAIYNIALLQQDLANRGDISSAVLGRSLEDALAAARRSGNQDVEAVALLRLGEMADSVAARRRLYRTGLTIGERINQFETIYDGLQLLGSSMMLEDPKDLELGAGLHDRAVDLVHNLGDLHVAKALMRKAAAYWDASRQADGGAEELGQRALVISLAALDAVDAVRDHQTDGLIRARTFARLASAYYSFIGNLLSPPEVAPAPEVLETAFAAMERMRARVLLDALDRARVTSPLAGRGPITGKRAAVLEEIARLQRRLLGIPLLEEERDRLLTALEQREVEEASLRAELARSDPAFANLRAPVFPTLDELERSLDESTALLSYLTPSRSNGRDLPGGISWLWVHTRGGTRVYPLPDHDEMAPAVKLYLGLLQNRDGSEERAAVSLYRALLGPAVRDLPGDIRRLIIVPDGSLHRLPFETLRARRDAEPIAVLYQISVAPSATIWLRWKRDVPRSAEVPALVLADPVRRPGESDFRRDGGEVGDLRAWALATGSRLGRLPQARSEARSAVRSLGGGSQVRIGEEATERFVKETDLNRYSVLHIAAHALVDDDRPERSGILLAPGAPEEDGLLQMREIVELDLAGRVVVLAACRSASGAVLEGEGVMGLARAFFQAGAHAVVGSLWPLRDDEAAGLFEIFYENLAKGASITDAMSAARRNRILAGAPAAAWGGLVVLGDGDLVPLPGGSSPFHDVRWRVAIVLILGFLVIAAWRLRAFSNSP